TAIAATAMLAPRPQPIPAMSDDGLGTDPGSSVGVTGLAAIGARSPLGPRLADGSRCPSAAIHWAGSAHLGESNVVCRAIDGVFGAQNYCDQRPTVFRGDSF